MGFTWSSVIVQDTTLGLLAASGFPEAAMVAGGQPPPWGPSRVASVAADDVMLFHYDGDQGEAELLCYDESLESHGAPRSSHTNISCASSMVALGGELMAVPPAFCPEAHRLSHAVSGTLALATHAKAAPNAVSSLLGVCQCIAILARLVSGLFDNVYAFVRREDQFTAADVPPEVIDELVLFAAL